MSEPFSFFAGVDARKRFGRDISRLHSAIVDGSLSISKIDDKHTLQSIANGYI